MRFFVFSSAEMRWNMREPAKIRDYEVDDDNNDIQFGSTGKEEIFNIFLS